MSGVAPPPAAAGRRTVLVVTLDTLAPQMAGPAIRAWEISRHLAAAGADVRLVTFGACSVDGDGFAARHIEVGSFRAEVEAVDVVVLQGFVVRTFPWLQSCPQRIVVDLYDPFQLETLEVDRYETPEVRAQALDRARAELDAQIARGDLFLCASRRQRDLWLGHLAAAGRVNPATYDDDPGLDRLVRVVPFGLADDAPVQQEHAVRGVVDGIGPDDKVVLWGGGVYNWFDPVTLVRAIGRLHAEDPAVRLYFLGMKHPNPDVPQMRVAVEARRVADELGLTGTVVHFNEEWVPYARRADHLLDADVGVSTHFAHVETEFSFRTRILDYLWAGLPIVTTRGDAFAELVDEHGLGVSVPDRDVDALVAALRTALADEGGRMRRQVRQVAPRFRWSQVLAPLVEYCLDPWYAADRPHERPVDAPAPVRAPAGRGVRADLGAVRRHLRSGGVRAVLSKVRWRWQTWRASR
ncbi:glycosyltransferase involved in cell wall biosynthesis [Cellulomonas sp. SLBN-39]|nr:glycosyltransferase involved in cell wall biosynthesis [Cellulomonas sp. SLBN-39]